MPGGFIGKYCVVDLTKGSSEVFELQEEFYKKYLSGYGLGAAIIAERQKAGIDPLSPQSHLGFCPGLLTGSGALFSGRLMVVGKSPLTGGWGDANSGGFISQEIKKAGYDAVFFTGAADSPVWVYVTDNHIEIKNASELWGKDTFETEEIIKSQLGDKKVQVASIGISGERLSLISGIVTDKGRVAARSGLGAVMGSKKLKAIAVKGSQKIPVQRPEILKKINSRFLKDYRQSKTPHKLIARFLNFLGYISSIAGISVPARPPTVKEVLGKYGTAGFTAYYSLVGDMPVKNWGGIAAVDYPIEKAEKISDDNVIKYLKRPYACQSCPLGCGGIIHIEQGRYQGLEGRKPEYESLNAFGGLILHDNLDAIIEIIEMCNRAGIDTVSTGASVAFAIECFENNLIDESITGGLKLGWGKSQEITRLTEMIIKREGFGDTLADGVKSAAKKIGQGSEKFAVHAGGQELPMHDSRYDHGLAVAYKFEPTPGRHMISSHLYANLYGVKKKFPEVRRRLKGAGDKEARNLHLLAAGIFYAQLLNGCGMCIFGALTSSLPVVEYLNAVTGWDLSADEYLQIGERILNLRKAFNVREGVKTDDQSIHPRALGKPPLSKGPLKDVTIDMEALQKKYLEIVGWEYPSGNPTAAKMKELNIASLLPAKTEKMK
jgi:aldehyde:ferredoxin oxidoreductase